MEPSDTIDNAKLKIQGMACIHPDKQSLTFVGKQLEDSGTLLNYMIHEVLQGVKIQGLRRLPQTRGSLRPEAQKVYIFRFI